MKPSIKFRIKTAYNRTLFFVLGVLIILGAAECSRKKIETTPPAEELYAKALAFYEGKPNLTGRLLPDAREKYSDTWARPIYISRNYTRAIEAFQEVIYYYPFSKYSILSEIRIADCHFEIEEFDIAAQAYEDFVRFHPVHEEIPYANYRLGLCHYNQMRKPGRDQTETEKALVQFELLRLRYPNTQYAEDAVPQINECKERLARHNFKIARFYMKRNKYWAAAARFEKVWRNYPETKQADEALFRQALCHDRLNRGQEAIDLYERLLSTYPESSFREQAASKKNSLENKINVNNTMRE